jgi:menaquinone-dependent protoporphyrinogen oxidase
MKAAKELVARESTALASVPVWLFSSGPVGSHGGPPKDDPADRQKGDEIAVSVGARDHRVFAGKLDRKGLSLLERAAVRAVKASDGDFRDWDEIRTWAAGIATTLMAEAA